MTLEPFVMLKNADKSILFTFYRKTLLFKSAQNNLQEQGTQNAMVFILDTARSAVLAHGKNPRN